MWQQIIRESLIVSSISGVSYTAYNPKRSLLERVFWIAIILVMMALATWQGLVVYTHYKERPVIVTIDKAYFDWKLTFPTATICIEELKSKSELKKVIKMLIEKYNFSESLLSSEFDLFVAYLRDLAFENYGSYERYEAYANGTKREYLEPRQYIEVLDQVVYPLEISKSKRRRVNNSPIKYYGSEMVRAIRIFTESGPCTVVNPNVGIYYTREYFNLTKPYEEYKPVYYVANEMASMTLKVNAEANSYIYFHAPNEVMDIVSRRIVIEQGFYTQAGLQTETVVTSEDVRSLTVEQKKCRLPYEPKEKPLDHSPVYSYNLCKFECRIQLAMERCNCIPYYYRPLGNRTGTICNLTGLYCLSKFKDDLIYVNTNTTGCQFCPENCDVSIFRPATQTKDEFFQTTFEMFMQFPKKIYVRTLIFSEIDLTVQIGGIFGLFLGCSLLSVVEIIYCLSLRLYCGTRGRNKDTSPYAR